MPGPPRKPTTLKILEGNPGKQALNKSEPHFTGSIGDCPDWLDAAAAAEWRAIAGALDSHGLIWRGNRGTLASYCVFTSLVEAASRALPRLKSGTKEYRSKFLELRQASDAQRYLAQEFGLTPSAQSKLTSPSSDRERSPMERILD